MRILDSKRARELGDDHDDQKGTPGRSTLTSRLPPAASSIAHAVVRQLQAKGDLNGPDAHEVAAYGMAGAGHSLPFLDQIQRAFGHHDISGVRAHIGGRADEASSALGASAYASGDSVAFGSSPDLRLAAHEAAHVVQQRGGVRLSGGLGSAGDEYEVNADAVADRVVRGESAQDLLDPFSHRGSVGGSAVQREEHAGSNPGVQDFDRMLLAHRSPTPAQIVACMRRHPDDARAIMARVRERLGESVVLQVTVEVGMTAPELVPVLGSPHAHGTSPVGTGTPPSTGLPPGAPPRTAPDSPVEAHRDGDGVTASVSPDAHSRVEASLMPGSGNPLRDVRIVISDETSDGAASGELEVGADLEDGRARASVSGEVHTGGDDAPTISGSASASVGSGEDGGADVRASGEIAIAVPIGDHIELEERGVIDEDGHIRVESTVELRRLLGGVSGGNRGRDALVRMFFSTDTDPSSGDTSMSGGASLTLRFNRDGDTGEDPAELHQIARSGFSGGGSSLPHLQQIQAAFGHHDVSGVRAHIGGAATSATGAMGARGFAYGDDVAFGSSPDLRLAAHEAAHVVQQRGGVRLSGGVGSAGDEYERHADAVADLVVRGESAQGLLDERAHRGAAGGPAIQRDLEADRVWLATLHHVEGTHYTHADGSELSTAETRRLRRVLRELSGGATRTAPADRPDTVSDHERLEMEHPEAEIPRTELDDDRARELEETGTSRRGRGRRGGAHDSATGGRTRRTVTLPDGRLARREDIRETRRHDDHGERVETEERGRRVEGVVGPTGETELISEDVTATTTVRDHNPLDGTLAHGRRREHRERDADGTGRRTVEHESTTADLGGGSIEHLSEVEAARTDEDGTERTRRLSVGTRGEIGGGRADLSLRTRAESGRTPEDGEETGTARETTSTVGAIVNEDETGVRLGSTTRHEDTEDGVTTARERSTSLDLTDRRVGVAHSRGGEIRDGDTRGTARVSGDGSFSIDVDPIDDGTGRFRLTFTIHVGASGSLGASHTPESGDRARASISARASAAGDLVTTRVISEADAQRYLHAADAAERGEDVSDPPEFDRLTRLRAAGENADALLQSGALLGDASAANAMADGDSITLDTSVGIGGDVSIGGTLDGVGGADIGAGGDASWRRTVQVERITVGGLPRVRLTVTYHDEREGHVEASASLADMGAARVRGASEAGSTDSVQFVIDPAGEDYEARYSAIVGTTDRTQLRALEREYAEDVRRSRHGTSGAEELEYEGGPASSAMIGLRERTTRSDEVTTTMDADGNPIGLAADISGGTESDLRVHSGDHDVDLMGSTESVHGTVDAAHGTRVDVEESFDHIDPLAAISDGVDAFSEADGRERVGLVLAHTPSEHLLSALNQFSHSWGYHLGEADLEAMGERAGDASRWGACCIVPDRDVLGAWSTLRGALARPRPDAAEARVDRNAAINIARIRALSTWMQNAAGHGTECIEHVLRRWGESRTHEVDAERLGTGYEWPVSLRATHETYTTLLTTTEGFRDRMESALSRPAGNTEARDHFNSVKADYEAVLSAVRGCGDFTSEARRSEMIREIEQHRADIFVRYRDFERRWRELHPSGSTSTDAPTDEAIAATRASGADITAERSRAYVRAGIRVLQGNHRHETEMLQQIQSIMRDVGDNPLFGNSERAEASQICGQVHDLHRTWIQQIEDLRQAYSQAGTPESSWEVSTGPGTTRNRELEPNVGWLIIEYSRVMRNNAFDAYWENRVDEWRQEGNDY